MKKSINVESWWLELLPNGTYHLLINTKERWMYYHRMNDETFQIGEDIEGESQEEWESKILEIPKFLPEIKNGTYIRSVSQEKDQISFYWMPYDFNWIKLRKEKLIFKSEDYA